MNQPKLTDAQRAIDDHADPGGGWAEVELQFLCHRGGQIPTHLEASMCKRVGDALRGKGLIAEDDGPVLTEAGEEALKVGRVSWNEDGTIYTDSLDAADEDYAR